MAKLRSKFILLVLAGTGMAFAQDPDQYKKLYEETLVQLQQSQDRKNQLANENAGLSERIARLEAEVRALRAASDRAELMAMQYSALRTLMTRYPVLQARFSEITGTPDTEPGRGPHPGAYEFYDRNWPFSAITAIEGS